MDNKTDTVVYRWFQQVWNAGLKSSIDELMDKDAIGHVVLGRKETRKEPRPLRPITMT